MASADAPSLLGAFSGYVTPPAPPAPAPVHEHATADAAIGPLGRELTRVIETVATNWAESCIATGDTITNDEAVELVLVRSREVKAIVDMAREEALRRLRPPPPVALHREEIVPPDAQASEDLPPLQFAACHTALRFRACCDASPYWL